MVSPWMESRSKIDDTITILCVRANSFINLVDGPVSASSANSHHGCFSRVQKANGIAEKHLKFSINPRSNRKVRQKPTPCLLKANDIDIWGSGGSHDFSYFRINSVPLIGNLIGRWQHNRILDGANLSKHNQKSRYSRQYVNVRRNCIYPDNSWRTELFFLGRERIATNFEIIFFGQIQRRRIQLNRAADGKKKDNFSVIAVSCISINYTTQLPPRLINQRL